MPVEDFNGDTFVAFMDISGFKEMLKGDGKRAVHALNWFNSSGFNALRSNANVNGFFVSDCGILFVRNGIDKRNKLRSILDVTACINRELLMRDVMLTTSIAYGPFSYHQRIEFNGIDKNPILGNAYVSALLDSETGIPRIQPGQCRIVTNNLETNVVEGIQLLRKLKNHIYYYWMVGHDDEISDFEKEYSDSYQLKYRGMLSALKRSNGG